MVAPTPNQSQIATTLVTFLQGILPGLEIIAGQDNRVPEPVGPDFLVFWPIRRRRLLTNIDAFVDAAGTGSISGTTMTVSAMLTGSILVGSPVTGAGVTAGTVVSAFGTGTGGVGTYTVSTSQIVAMTTLQFGVSQALMSTEVLFQCDVHGPNSADNAQAFSTLFRDDYAVEVFTNNYFGSFDITPLHADDPRQVPFISAEQQFESRWIVEALIQANQTVVVPLQFTQLATLTLKEVEALFPP